MHYSAGPEIHPQTTPPNWDCNLYLTVGTASIGTVATCTHPGTECHIFSGMLSVYSPSFVRNVTFPINWSRTIPSQLYWHPIPSRNHSPTRNHEGLALSSTALRNPITYVGVQGSLRDCHVKRNCADFCLSDRTRGCTCAHVRIYRAHSGWVVRRRRGACLGLKGALCAVGLAPRFRKLVGEGADLLVKLGLRTAQHSPCFHNESTVTSYFCLWIG